MPMSPGEWMNPISDAMHHTLVFVLLMLSVTLAAKLAPAWLFRSLWTAIPLWESKDLRRVKVDVRDAARPLRPKR